MYFCSVSVSVSVYRSDSNVENASLLHHGHWHSEICIYEIAGIDEIYTDKIDIIYGIDKIDTIDERDTDEIITDEIDIDKIVADKIDTDEILSYELYTDEVVTDEVDTDEIVKIQIK